MESKMVGIMVLEEGVNVGMSVLYEVTVERCEMFGVTEFVNVWMISVVKEYSEVEYLDYVEWYWEDYYY